MSTNPSEQPEAWPSPEQVEQNAPREDGSHGLPGYGQPPDELRKKMRAPEREEPLRRKDEDGKKED